MRVFPFRFTNKFNERLRTLFYVADFSSVTQSIQHQFKAGVAELVQGDVYMVMIKDIPAHVVMENATLISVRYAG